VRAFVTGGSGFLGQRIVARLLARGDEVVCLLRNGSDASPLWRSLQVGASGHLEVARGTLEQPDTYRDALAGCTVIYHTASASRGAVPVLFLTNVVAARALLGAARDAGVRRFVLVSSIGVYGAGVLAPHALLDESCPLDPHPHLRDGYSYSKIAQERVAWDVSRAAGPGLVVIRPGVIYGPGRSWISSRVGLRVGETIVAMGGRRMVPYTYVDNCADAVCCAGVAPAIEGHAFNIVDDDLPTAAALLRRYRRQVGQLRVVPVPAWAIGPLSRASQWYHEHSEGQLPAVLTLYRSRAMWTPLRFSNSKAKRMLRWRPQTSVDEGLDLTAEALCRTPRMTG